MASKWQAHFALAADEWQEAAIATGLNHPSEEERSIARLHQEGHSFDPVEIRRWAQRTGWTSGAAADLEAVACKSTR